MLRNSSFNGSKIQNFEYLYPVKEKYFDKQYRRKNAYNDVLKNIQPSKFLPKNGPDKEIMIRPLKPSFSGILRTITNF